MKRQLLTCAVAFVCSIYPLHAAAITYIDTVSGASGSLDGHAFTGALVVATFTGNTSNIVNVPFGSFGTVPAIPVTGNVIVQGIGADTLTDTPMYLVSASQPGTGNAIVAFLDEGPGGIGWPDPNGCAPNGICYGIGEFITPSTALYGYNLTATSGTIQSTPLGTIGPGFSDQGGGSTIYDVANGCPPGVNNVPQCKGIYPTGSGGTFYWTSHTGATSTFAAVPSFASLTGGTPASPIFLIGSNVGGVTGTIGGQGSQQYYSFYWNGGAFSATAAINGANAGASYLFSEGSVGSCNSTSQTMNGADGYTGTISVPNLAAGTYCIGIDANNPADPAFSLVFDTTVGTPEPSEFALTITGLAALLAIARRRRLSVS